MEFRRVHERPQHQVQRHGARRGDSAAMAASAATTAAPQVAVGHRQWWALPWGQHKGAWLATSVHELAS